MATNRVHGGHRLRVYFGAAHKAGDLVYEKGFYGICEEDAVVSTYGYIILQDVWLLPRAPATVAMGVTLAALATSIATTLPLLAYAGLPTFVGPATAGMYPVGKTIATGNASGYAKVQMFNPNSMF
jgi:hypothetical protein